MSSKQKLLGFKTESGEYGNQEAHGGQTSTEMADDSTSWFQPVHKGGGKEALGVLEEVRKMTGTVKGPWWDRNIGETDCRGSNCGSWEISTTLASVRV